MRLLNIPGNGVIEVGCLSGSRATIPANVDVGFSFTIISFGDFDSIGEGFNLEVPRAGF